KPARKRQPNRPPGTHHSPSISGLNSSSSARRLDRLLRLRWLTARCPTPSHLALHGRMTSAYHSSRWVVQHSKIPRLRSESGQNENSPILGLCQLLPPAPDIGLPMLPPLCAISGSGPSIHSALMPASLIIGHHFSISAFW